MPSRVGNNGQPGLAGKIREMTTGPISGTGPVAHALELLNAESVSIVEAHIRRGIEEGNIRADIDPHAESVAIIGAMRGVSAQFLFPTGKTSAEAVRQALMDLVRRGLRDEATKE